MLPFVVVGLGNPGKSYAKTRHNIGFEVVKRLAARLGAVFREDSKLQGLHAKALVGDRSLHLLLPSTYMNESGQAVAAIARFYKALAPEVLIVHDDIAIPFGMLRVRMRGSPGGHNGLKSVEAALGTSNYPRLKVGIGDERDNTLVDHVLSPFTREEQEELQEFIDHAAKVVYDLLTTDIHKVMAAVNVKGKSDEKTVESIRRDVHPECDTQR